MAISSPRRESEIDVISRPWSLVQYCRAALFTRALPLLVALAPVQASAGEHHDFEDFFGAYKHRIEGVTIGAGDAAESNAASQIINPWPVYSQDRDILTESPRMIGVIKRYYNGGHATAVDVQSVPQPNPDAGAEPQPDTNPKSPPGLGASPASDSSAGE